MITLNWNKRQGFATGGLYSSPGAVWGMFFFNGFAHFILRVLDYITETPADCNDRA